MRDIIAQPPMLDIAAAKTLSAKDVASGDARQQCRGQSLLPLCVIDTSMMPRVPGGNNNVGSIVIAKATDMILGNSFLPSSRMIWDVRSQARIGV